MLTWIVRYFKLCNITDADDCYIFRSIYRNVVTGQSGLKAADKPLAYSTLSEMFKNRFANIGYEDKSLSLHSLRAGGVTLAVEQGVPERLYKEHGRWASDAVQDYITENVENKLSVTKALDM